jgi:hypothetical protein
MQTFKSQHIPILALLVTVLTAFAAESLMPGVHPYAVYRYPLAIGLLFIFFRFIAFADKRRSAQLDDVGLLRPLQDGAFLVCTHAHLQEVGLNLTWLSPGVGIKIGLLSWASLLLGHYAPKQPGGLPHLLISALPFVSLANKDAFCKGLMISGGIGLIGTFAPAGQIWWFLAPLAMVIVRAHRTRS